MGGSLHEQNLYLRGCPPPTICAQWSKSDLVQSSTFNNSGLWTTLILNGISYLHSFFNLVCANDWTMSTPNGADQSMHLWEHLCQYSSNPLKTDEKLRLIITDSAGHFPIVLKFGRLLCYEILWTGVLKIHFRSKPRWPTAGQSEKINWVFNHPHSHYRRSCFETKSRVKF